MGARSRYNANSTARNGLYLLTKPKDGGLLSSSSPAWIFLAESLALPTGLITAAFLTRTLGPSDYGLLALAGGVITWLQLTVTTSLSRFAVKLVAGDPEPRGVVASLMRLYLASGVIFTALVALLAGPISAALEEPRLEFYLRFYCLDILLFALAQGYRSVRIGLGHLRRRAGGTAARWLLRMALILILVGAGYGVTGAIAASIAASIAELAVNFWGTPRLLWMPGRVDLRPMLRLGWEMAATSVCLRLFERIDLFLLKQLGGDTATVGQYAAAQNATFGASVLMATLSPPLLAAITRALRVGDEPLAREEGRKAVRLAILLTPAFAITVACAPPLAVLFFGAKFAPVGRALAILIAASGALVWLSIVQALLMGIGRTTMTFATTAAMLVATTLLHFVVIPAYGMNGAALATFLGAAAGATASAVALARQGWMPFPRTTAIRAAGVTALLLPAAVYWPAAGSMALVKLAVLLGAWVLLLPILGESFSSRASR